jgi:sulfite exporter TauE/SafE
MPPDLISSFIAGLTGSAHCFAMCGGIAGALGMHAKAAGSGGNAAFVSLLYQFGRISGYALAGGLVGLIGAQAAQLMDLMRIASALRIASGVIVALLGLRLLLRWNALRWIEELGARFWMRLRPLVQFAGSRTGLIKPLSMGLLWLWSLLPCGLIYSMLLLAAMSADPGRGALIMLAFGAGTLPSMFSMSALSGRLQSKISQPAVRIASGVAMAALGIAMILSAVMMGGGGEHGHHH